MNETIFIDTMALNNFYVSVIIEFFELSFAFDKAPCAIEGANHLDGITVELCTEMIENGCSACFGNMGKNDRRIFAV